MEFKKERNGSQVRVLKSVYDPVTKRCRQRTVCKFSADSRELPEEVASTLTPEEVVEITDDYIKPNIIKQDKFDALYALTELSDKMKRAIPAVEAGQLTDVVAQELQASYKLLTKAMRKAGLSLKKSPVKRSRKSGATGQDRELFADDAP